MKGISNYIDAIWRGAGTFALVTFLQQLSPLSEHWIQGTHFAWLAPVVVAIFSALAAHVRAQEPDGRGASGQASARMVFGVSLLVIVLVATVLAFTAFTATATDHVTVSVTVDDATVTEGDDTRVRFTLSEALDSDVNVPIIIGDNPADAAADWFLESYDEINGVGDDFDSRSGVTFPAGITAVTFVFSAAVDVLVEGDEVVPIRIAAENLPVPLVIGESPSVTVTIQDPDVVDLSECLNNADNPERCVLSLESRIEALEARVVALESAAATPDHSHDGCHDSYTAHLADGSTTCLPVYHSGDETFDHFDCHELHEDITHITLNPGGLDHYNLIDLDGIEGCRTVTVEHIGVWRGSILLRPGEYIATYSGDTCTTAHPDNYLSLSVELQYPRETRTTYHHFYSHDLPQHDTDQALSHTFDVHDDTYFLSVVPACGREHGTPTYTQARVGWTVTLTRTGPLSSE